jgi:hypothetical protein
MNTPQNFVITSARGEQWIPEECPETTIAASTFLKRSSTPSNLFLRKQEGLCLDGSPPPSIILRVGSVASKEFTSEGSNEN